MTRTAGRTGRREFNQLDLEMSFVDHEDVFSVVEQVLTDCARSSCRPGRSPPRTRESPTADAMAQYGTDKPDLRFSLELTDVSDFFAASEFRAFAGQHVRALAVPGGAARPRSFFSKMEDFAVERGAKGLAWVR